MKRFIKVISALTIIILIIAVSIVPSFAAGELTVNGETAKKGDVVTYTLNLADCEEPVVGLHMFLDYDKEYLEMVEDSLDFGELNGKMIHNGTNQENSDDGIIFCFTDPSSPADFSKAKNLITVDFKVLKGGETDIEFFVTDLYGMDMTYMKSYTFTYNLSVNKELVIKDQTPILVTDQDFINENQGQFVNYVDGKGESNGEADAKRETVMGVTTAPATDVLKGTEKNSSFDLTTIIVLIAVILIVLIIVVLVIVRNALNRSKKEEMSVSTEEKTE